MFRTTSFIFLLTLIKVNFNRNSGWFDKDKAVEPLGLAFSTICSESTAQFEPHSVVISWSRSDQ